ncbi:DUF554 domain-containing protein [Calidifontibacillus erzurumensis]|uniref:DUF554 domain-containing protein n=1 Tax=Calidifontibacillus erzurumensis TaxID=2741433 RepID=A0A8J8GEG1_9BACI|nr:DUF554 domain-containing protein [Calidifontibacillus erzurumensis]NSL52365.1 DUF554 domain-containing protein [Calidifontibacillus erzurumensis]
MVLLGTIVNGVAIIVGTFLGKILHRIPEKIKTLVLQSIGLAVAILGIQMGLKSEQFLIVILSLLFGSIIGELFDLDGKLNALGLWIEKRIGTKEEGGIAKGFVSATLIFVIGAMAIIGALDSGLRGDHQVLYTKSLLDGFTSIVLTTTFGIGVLFSAFPVMIYQGFIALFATQIEKWVPAPIMDGFITEMTAAGGIMILAIGLNMLEITRVRVANMLPAILVVAVIVTGQYFYQQLFL